MRVKVTDIEYDYDADAFGSEWVEYIESLPSTIEFSDLTFSDKDELEEHISDEISNITGFCHKGFKMKLL